MNWNCPEFNRFHHSFVVPAAKCIIRWYGYPYLRGREWTQQKTLPSYKETFILIGRCLGSENILLDKRTKLNYRNILYLSQSFIHPVNPSKRYEIYKKIYSQLYIDQMCNCNCIIIICYVLREKWRSHYHHTLSRKIIFVRQRKLLIPCGCPRILQSHYYRPSLWEIVEDHVQIWINPKLTNWRVIGKLWKWE